MNPTELSRGPIGLLIGADRITATSQQVHSHIDPATGQPNAAVALAGAAEIDIRIGLN